MEYPLKWEYCEYDHDVCHIWPWYGVKVHLRQTEYYKPSTVAEHNTTDITDIVQVRDIAGSNIELSACAPNYVRQSVSKPGQTSKVAYSTVIEHDPKPEWKTLGHTDPVGDKMNNQLKISLNIHTNGT